MVANSFIINGNNIRPRGAIHSGFRFYFNFESRLSVGPTQQSAEKWNYQQLFDGLRSKFTAIRHVRGSRFLYETGFFPLSLFFPPFHFFYFTSSKGIPDSRGTAIFVAGKRNWYAIPDAPVHPAGFRRRHIEDRGGICTLGSRRMITSLVLPTRSTSLLRNIVEQRRIWWIEPRIDRGLNSVSRRAVMGEG